MMNKKSKDRPIVLSKNKLDDLPEKLIEVDNYSFANYLLANDFLSKSEGIVPPPYESICKLNTNTGFCLV